MKIGDKVYGGIYAGKINSHHIICSPIEYELPFEVNWVQAKEYSNALGMELPTKEELNLLYEMHKINTEYFPKRKCNWYWSSTESSSTSAWNQGFNLGYQNAFSKNSFNYVRAVQRIKI